jgi:hypothetical protein
VFGVAVLIWLVSGIVVLVLAFRKLWRKTAIAAGVCTVGFVTMIAMAPPSESSDKPRVAVTNTTRSRHAQSPKHSVQNPKRAALRTATSTPHPVAYDNKPSSTADLKREFIAGVDESITGKRIAGNSRKFIGNRVDLHGVVVNVVDDHTFNFRTGDIAMDDSGNISNTVGMIVVQCESTQDLEADQHLRVLGTVVDPVEGTNAMGGSMMFPTVEAKYME